MGSYTAAKLRPEVRRVFTETRSSPPLLQPTVGWTNSQLLCCKHSVCVRCLFTCWERTKETDVSDLRYCSVHQSKRQILRLEQQKLITDSVWNISSSAQCLWRLHVLTPELIWTWIKGYEHASAPLRPGVKLSWMFSRQVLLFVSFTPFLCVSLQQMFACAKSLFISDQDKRKHFRLLLQLFLGNRQEVGSFQSRMIKVISKPSQKRQSMKNADCESHLWFILHFLSVSVSRSFVHLFYYILSNRIFYDL